MTEMNGGGLATLGLGMEVASFTLSALPFQSAGSASGPRAAVLGNI